MAALSFEIKHRIDHMFDHAGASDLAVLGDVANEDHGNSHALGKAGEFMCGGADLRDRTRSGADIVGPHGLDRIDDREGRSFGLQSG